MQNENVNILWCNSCKTPLSPQQRSYSIRDYGIITCNCSAYPILNGIVIYNRSKVTKRVLASIRGKKYIRATLMAIDVNIFIKTLLGLYLFIILLFPKLDIPYFKIRKLYLYNIVLRYLTLFSNNRLWWKYVITRNKMPTYYISSIVGLFPHKFPKTLLDIGCGTGNILHMLTRRMPTISSIGIDISFLGLLISRLFIVNDATILINANATNLPIHPKKADIILFTDAWQYIPKNTVIIQMIKTIASTTSTIFLCHIFNPPPTYRLHSISRPTDPRNTMKILKKAGFTTFSLLSNKEILESFINRKPLSLLSKPVKSIERAIAYSLIGGKNTFPKYIFPDKATQNLIQQQGIDYYQDQELLDS